MKKKKPYYIPVHTFNWERKANSHEWVILLVVALFIFLFHSCSPSYIHKTGSFDTADVIVSEPYNLQIDDSGQLTEMVLYLRILNENKRMYGLTLYEMPLNTGEIYQEPLRIQNKNYFERTIYNLPQVLSILNGLGYEFDLLERYVG